MTVDPASVRMVLSDDNKKMNNFTIVSGFTLKTPYESEVQFLRESLKKFSLTDEHIVGYENQGTWRKNCQYKALIIKSKLEELNSPVVWLDADAVLLSYPKLFIKKKI